LDIELLWDPDISSVQPTQILAFGTKIHVVGQEGVKVLGFGIVKRKTVSSESVFGQYIEPVNDSEPAGKYMLAMTQNSKGRSVQWQYM
jgi:hypothetical protein